jgi:hypothetical protein
VSVSDLEPVGWSEPGPRERLAAALRPIITMTVASELGDDALTEAAVAVEAVAQRLAEAAGPRRPHQPSELAQVARGFFPASPIIGVQNPLAPPVRIWAVDGVDGGYRELRGTASFDYAYEGPPSCVHGGVIAETFDELLGAANFAAGNPGMTGTLTVRYRKPTPLRVELRLEARCLRRRGRKITAWAGMYHGDTLTAEADGLFIEVGPAQFEAIMAGNQERVDPGMLEAVHAEVARVAGQPGGDPTR